MQNCDANLAVPCSLRPSDSVFYIHPVNTVDPAQQCNALHCHIAPLCSTRSVIRQTHGTLLL